MELNADSITVLRSAFVMYEEKIELVMKTQPVTPEAISRTKVRLDSIRNKLFINPPETDFSFADLKCLFDGLKIFRECIEEGLSDFSAPDRELSLTMQRSCNRLLREIRHFFLENGVEPERID